MVQAVLAGLAYVGIVFAVGFVLGFIRTTLLVPFWGETKAVLTELPVMLLASFFTARWLISVFQVGPFAADRLVMGLLAFVCLLLAEWLLSTQILGRSKAQYFQHYQTLAGVLGLSAQIGFALIPLLLL